MEPRLPVAGPVRVVRHRAGHLRHGYEHANSAFLCDASALAGGYYYLFYAGSNELTRFDGWGHAKIGVARSTDLVHWQVPPA